MRITRRSVLSGTGALMGAAALPLQLRAAGPYTVGVGRDPNGYTAARRAILAGGEWQALNLSGKTVVIKPNLVWPTLSSAGITTDPEVVRAVVDLAFEAGAAQIIIVETAKSGANFTPCGYDFFRTYDAQNRIRLVDLGQEPTSLYFLPDGLAWKAVYIPDVVMTPGIVFISVAKLKTHAELVATLSTKNLFGLAAIDRYPSNGNVGPWAPRLALHDRGGAESVVDISRLRPTHFSVIDGIWGMEGFGPVAGTPVRMDTVLAGANTVAVDRVALLAMGMPQYAVPYLTFASRLGGGPASMAEISVVGDTLSPRTFATTTYAPCTLDLPVVSPTTINPTSGQQASIRFWYSETVTRRIAILRLYDDRITFDLVRVLRPNTTRAAGFELVTWDGRADDGSIVPPGRYAVHVLTTVSRAVIYIAAATGWVWVQY